MTVFLNRRAAARYRALASIIPGPHVIKKKFTGPQSHKGEKAILLLMAGGKWMVIERFPRQLDMNYNNTID
jgi:hypothetical protein